MNIQQPPIEPPIPATELEVFFNIGQMTFHFLTLFVLLILILYSYKVLKDILPVIIVYSFSILIAMNYIQHGHPPFTPMFEIFFLVFQTGILLLAGIDKKDNFKINKGK